MITKRIIPCLDIRNGRVVKGVNFQGVQDVEDPVALAKRYNDAGADELVFYDITASIEGRSIFTDILRDVARQIFIPLTVGGAINTLEDFDRVLKAGADKVSVNSGAIKNPQLIQEAAQKYGSQCVVLSMDVARVEDKYCLFTKGGRENTGIDAMAWAEKCEALGAGEIVLNSIDTDGVKEGFDLAMLEELSRRVSVPIIASGGAGSMEHFKQLFQLPGIDAGLAASIFHFDTIKIDALKQYLCDNGIEMRLEGSKQMSLNFDENGLMPVVVQDFYTKKVLTVAYMNEESLAITLQEKRTCFWSRSRKELWRKGETSGNVQHVVRILTDCDEDALVVEVIKEGPACHLGTDSCFTNQLFCDERLQEFSLDALYALLAQRNQERPEGSYTTYLFEKGDEKILKKIGEESTEVIIGAMKHSNEETIYEISDLCYHVLVLMVAHGITLEDVRTELASRHIIDHKTKQETMQ